MWTYGRSSYMLLMLLSLYRLSGRRSPLVRESVGAGLRRWEEDSKGTNLMKLCTHTLLALRKSLPSEIRDPERP